MPRSLSKKSSTLTTLHFFPPSLFLSLSPYPLVAILLVNIIRQDAL
ncbi:hypothetical protein CPAR01_14704 [Colletotrichum paranaense]|uniref:Uncharacterized protein n=2 Tax=Colletotrichum acutatum species complex TaxID=2707335 RepID=A0AAI9U4R5_9PEZI|nr:uncharacterized protein CPAR01_14704 [Colletotrichum paranaense]KAK1451663.1 hypothetical protein CMEL01_06237 [Colletotrichum melonis]KAK1521787.1 hypothetical protein CPAR01_14704 [Colletotrichum paranaense]